MHVALPRHEQLPNGVLRTHGVADRRLTDALAYAEFRCSPTMWVAVLPGLILLPMIVGSSLFGLVLGGPSTWQYHTVTTVGLLLAAAVLAAVLLLGLPVFGSIARGRWRWRLELPPGTPIYADFGPEWIGTGWSGTYRAVQLVQLQRVRRIGTTLVLSGGGNTVLLPSVLVPADVGTELQSGAWRARLRRPVRQQLQQLHPAAAPPRHGADAGVLHLRATADSGLAARLAAAANRSPAMRRVLWLMLVMPLVALLLMWAKNGGRLEPAAVLTLVAVFGSGAAVVGYFACFGTAAKMRELVPAGAPISADYGPGWVGVRLGSHVQTAQLDQVKRIDEIDGIWVLTMRGMQPGLVVPAELVPPQVRAEWVQRSRP